MRMSLVVSALVAAAVAAVLATAIASCATGNEQYISAPHGPYTPDGSDWGDGSVSPGKDADAYVQKDAPKAPGDAQQCGICYKDEDCAKGFACVMSPWGDRFCAAYCPPTCQGSGLVCAPHNKYPPSLDAGAGADADAEAGMPVLAADAATGTGVCVPPSFQTCPCSPERQGVLRNCSVANSFGSCSGQQSCENSAWAGCEAPTPSKEVCDGVDNNCNGLIDSLDTTVTATDLCAGDAGAPHASFTCANAKCELGGCEQGWTKYPASVPDSAGCPCPVDKADIAPASDNDCSKAQAQGSLSDVGAAPVTLTGTLSSDTDVDWFGIETQDTKQAEGQNTYRIHVEFTATGNPGDEFRFDVTRGPTGTQCQGTAKQTLTSYDWCATNQADADCAGSYRIKVYRNAGATPTCSAYAITVSSGGQGACPAADPCGAQ